MRSLKNAFYIGNNRVMVSLGPLTDKKYCPYSCAFCYVKSGFMKYMKLEIDQIIEFLNKNKENYDIVYISGDTDSFAPPRTSKAIELIKTISENLDVDITFTTRTTFNEDNLKELKNINDYMKSKDHKLIVSISISRLYSADYIEPSPIPNPEERIEMLKKLKEIGLYTILATRPFLPIIKPEEYIEIIRKSKDYIDVVLGETWYADKKLIEDVCRDLDITKIEFIEKTMDFDDNNKMWKCYEAKETVEKVSKFCKENKIPFFMRSHPAIDYIRRIKS